ncbi:Molybdopterin-guanine dinucleotide biosynthesis protein [metagenome]|uniref:Molybdopterin-guanine dinucleotide biosynthesis protein n=1 Tax=metagenome TaxID=256318 RepID=A0A2P2C0V9_9ZZZZ
MPEPAFAAVILAGGTGVRLDGADKAALDLEGRTLLHHAVHAVRGALPIVVVADPVDPATLGGAAVRFVREEPAYGGPAAALLTGIDELPEGSTTVVVLAVDMPRVTRDTVARLLEAGRGGDGAALVDPRGRRQLAMALDLARVRQCAPARGTWHGLPMRSLLAPLELVAVEPVGEEGRDVDDWSDLRDLRNLGP